jgi:hypothetical protein
VYSNPNIRGPHLAQAWKRGIVTLIYVYSNPNIRGPHLAQAWNRGENELVLLLSPEAQLPAVVPTQQLHSKMSESLAFSHEKREKYIGKVINVYQPQASRPPSAVVTYEWGCG